MKAQKSSTIARWSSGLIEPTHGAEHLSMYPRRQGRPEVCARWKTPRLQVRMGNTRSSWSTVSRIAQACAYGPK